MLGDSWRALGCEKLHRIAKRTDTGTDTVPSATSLYVSERPAALAYCIKLRDLEGMPELFGNCVVVVSTVHKTLMTESVLESRGMSQILKG